MEKKEMHNHDDSDSDDHHDHGNAHGDHDDHGHDHKGEVGPDGKRANRGEKKIKKALLKLGLIPVTGITRVTIRKGKNVGTTI
jgi:nascent polypeptide-associated complex subunit alpha